MPSADATPAHTRGMLCRSNPSKLAVESAWAMWFVVWSAIMTAVMATDLGGMWEDAGLMTLGVGLGVATFVLPAVLKHFVIDWIVPVVFRVRFTRVERTYAHLHYLSDLWTMFVGVTGLSFGLSLLMTPFFFDVLHMRYGFKTTWEYDRTPLFLYWITIAYFSSYSVLGAMLYRWAAWRSVPERRETNVRKAGERARRVVGGSEEEGGGAMLPWYTAKALCMRIFASFLLAFLETLMMANPMIDHLFCYDDYFLTITFGSACYGVSFVFAIWSWTSSVPEDAKLGGSRMEEKNQQEEVPICPSSWGWMRGGAWHSLMCSLLSSLLTTFCLALIRAYVAPYVTTVVNNSPAFGGCLLKG